MIATGGAAVATHSSGYADPGINERRALNAGAERSLDLPDAYHKV